MSAERKRLPVALLAFCWNMLGGGFEAFSAPHTSRNYLLSAVSTDLEVINKCREIGGSQNWNQDNGVIVLA